MELLIFGHGGARVLAFPTRVGRFFDYENMGMIESIRHKIEQGWMQVICVDSIDHETFYCQWCEPRNRILRHMKYEQYILHEVLPLSWHINRTPFLTALGCSFGAFHAVNISLRNPQAFNRVVAISGRYDLTKPVDGFRDLLDGYYDDNVYFNTPPHYLVNLNESEKLEAIRRLDIKIIVGEYDPFLPDNRQLSDIMWSKGIWHLLKTWNGRAHGPRRWREMLNWFL